MAYSFGSLVFTPTIKAMQERYGSRPAYAKREASAFVAEPIGPSEAQFLAECDSFYMASVGESGWPYVQHRGGPKGFLKVIDDRTIAFADYRGNKQYISSGNFMTEDRVALILVDYDRVVAGFAHPLGQVKIFEGAEARVWTERVREPGYDAVIERVFVISVKASDWNCQQHITPRFTEEQIRVALEPVEKRMRELERENEELRRQLGKPGPSRM